MLSTASGIPLLQEGGTGGISLAIFRILCLSGFNGPHLNNFLLLVDGSISFIQFMHSVSGMPIPAGGGYKGGGDSFSCFSHSLLK